MQGARVLLDAPTIFVSRIGDIYRRRNRPLILDLEAVESRKTEKSSHKGYYASICYYYWHIDLYSMTN